MTTEEFKEMMGNVLTGWVLDSFEDGYAIKRNTVTGNKRKVYPDGHVVPLVEWR